MRILYTFFVDESTNSSDGVRSCAYFFQYFNIHDLPAQGCKNYIGCSPILNSNCDKFEFIEFEAILFPS